MRIGYARVSTQEQDTQAQILALKKAGCERIFQEKASGGCWDRPELHRLLDQLRKGDVVVVRKADKIANQLVKAQPFKENDKNEVNGPIKRRVVAKATARL